MKDNQPEKKKSKVKPAIIKMTANRTGTVAERRNAWSKIIMTHKNEMNGLIRKEQATWRKETEKIEEELKEGDWTGLWAQQKAKKPKPTAHNPLSYTKARQEDGKQDHIWKKEEVMEHIRTETHAIAEPPEVPTSNEEDRILEKLIRDEGSVMQREAYKANNWIPDSDDVATMFKYMREAYTKRTAQGPDDITPDLILFADEIMLQQPTQTLPVSDNITRVQNKSKPGCTSQPPTQTRNVRERPQAPLHSPPPFSPSATH
jgi:hypothetical protein